jgi:N-acetylmuramoyl-L-alanine amidase
MDFLPKYPITQRLLPQPSARRRGYAMPAGVKFIVAHDTGNPNSSAAQNVAYFARTANPTNCEISSAHLFVDDRAIIECIPVFAGRPEKAWHVLPGANNKDRMYGYHANDAAIGVEYCYGTRVDADQAYRRYVWVIAYACYRFGLIAATDVVGHFMLDPHRKTDPLTGLGHSRRSYEQFLRDVVTEYQACSGGHASAPAPVATPACGAVKAAVRLHIRKNAPSTMSDICGVAEVGTLLEYVGVVPDGEAVNGNGRWYRTRNGDYFWSGGTVKGGAGLLE